MTSVVDTQNRYRFFQNLEDYRYSPSESHHAQPGSQIVALRTSFRKSSKAPALFHDCVDVTPCSLW